MYQKIIVGMLVFLLLLCPTKIEGASHADFTKLTFDPGSVACLMEDLPQSRINQAYDKIKRKAFGWYHYTIFKDVPVHYEADVVFAKANRTSRELSFNYIYQTESTNEVSISVSGDISVTASGKVEEINGSLNTKIRTEIGFKNKIFIAEETRTVFVIPPFTKLTVQLKGDARLNNGVAKYYFLGICFKKGTWEIIDKVTEYYDYYEEQI